MKNERLGGVIVPTTETTAAPFLKDRPRGFRGTPVSV